MSILGSHRMFLRAVVPLCLFMGLSQPTNAEGQSTASVTLAWVAPGDDGNVGTAAVYDVRFYKDSITEANWSLASQIEGEPPPRLAGTLEVFTISGLPSNSTLFFAVKAADEAGNWSPVSNSPRAITPDLIPPAQITDVTIIDAHGNSSPEGVIPISIGARQRNH
jgi:hypothetical protein